jgi:hypothetical protein
VTRDTITITTTTIIITIIIIIIITTTTTTLIWLSYGLYCAHFKECLSTTYFFFLLYSLNFSTEKYNTWK